MTDELGNLEEGTRGIFVNCLGNLKEENLDSNRRFRQCKETKST
jgi:hypothetical protein